MRDLDVAVLVSCRAAAGLAGAFNGAGSVHSSATGGALSSAFFRSSSGGGSFGGGFGGGFGAGGGYSGLNAACHDFLEDPTPTEKVVDDAAAALAAAEATVAAVAGQLKDGRALERRQRRLYEQLVRRHVRCVRKRPRSTTRSVRRAL